MTKLQRIREQISSGGCDQCESAQLLLEVVDAVIADQPLEKAIAGYEFHRIHNARPEYDDKCVRFINALKDLL